MLIGALVALLFLGSSGTSAFLSAFENAKGSIEKQIDDRPRRAELLAIIDKAEQGRKDFAKQTRKAAEELAAAARRQEMKEDDLQPILQRVRADSEAYQEQIIRHRLELKDRMSREEWARAFPRP
jgi:predicted ribosomally synthesized peptide with SipW-like signal peptide